MPIRLPRSLRGDLLHIVHHRYSNHWALSFSLPRNANRFRPQFGASSASLFRRNGGQFAAVDGEHLPTDKPHLMAQIEFIIDHMVEGIFKPTGLDLVRKPQWDHLGLVVILVLVARHPLPCLRSN